MLELLQAIKKTYDSTAGAALRALTPGGLHAGIAPNGTAVPFITYPETDGTAEDIKTPTGPQSLDTVRVQFSFWDAGAPGAFTPKRVMAARKAFDALFNFQHDTLNNNLPAGATVRVASFRRVSTGRLVVDPDGKTYGLHVDFEAVIG